MSVLFHPLKYLHLRAASGRLLLCRDVIGTLILTVLLIAPFVIIRNTNFFADHGFVDRIGGLASVLTGFYVAALVAIATFGPQLGDLDSVILIGEIHYYRPGFNVPEKLTRREYVCSIFGYLSFLSLFISISSIVSALISVPLAEFLLKMSEHRPTFGYFYDIIAYSGKIIFCIAISHLILVSCHGLFYMTERIYDKPATMLPKDPPTP